MSTLESIHEWQRLACPNPDDSARTVAIGCHLEEVAEAFEALGWESGSSHLMACDAKRFKEHIPAAVQAAQTADRKALLDSLCDQIVTAIGVAYRYGFDIHGALAEVNRSNWSKLVDGRFQYDANGKVIKPDSYSAPDLGPFVGEGDR